MRSFSRSEMIFIALRGPFDTNGILGWYFPIFSSEQTTGNYLRDTTFYTLLPLRTLDCFLHFFHLPLGDFSPSICPPQWAAPCLVLALMQLVTTQGHPRTTLPLAENSTLLKMVSWTLSIEQEAHISAPCRRPPRESRRTTTDNITFSPTPKKSAKPQSPYLTKEGWHT